MRATFLALTIVAALALVAPSGAFADEEQPLKDIYPAETEIQESGSFEAAADAATGGEEGIVVALPSPCSAPSCAPSCAPSVEPCRRPCGIWVRLEALAAKIEGPEGLVGPATGNPDQFTWDDFGCDARRALGGRLTFGVWRGKGWQYILSGAFYGRWQATSTQTGVLGYSTMPGAPVLASPVNTTTLETEAALWSAEFHAWRTLCDRRCLAFDVGFGARYAAFDEEVSGGFGRPFTNSPALPSFASNVDNHFAGGQVGAMVRWTPGRRFTFRGSLKGLAGIANQRIEVSDQSIFVGGAHSSDIHDTAFGWGLDAEVGVDVHLNRNWSLNLGYQFLYLDPVVRAYETLDFTQAATGAVQARKVEDTLMVHAVFLGVTWTQ